MKFSSKTFAYFDAVHRNAHDRNWFEQNRELYTEHVEVPFEHLVRSLHDRLGSALPGISFSARRISKPVLRQKDATSPALRDKVTVFFGEKTVSMFETNPGIYISIGASPDDNVIGCGLYMPSARQFRELRPRLAMDPPELRALLAESDLQKHWAGLGGDRFSRFPRGFDQATPGAEYLWQKQWLLSKSLKRTAVTKASFLTETTEAFAAALPFIAWTRKAVGVYKKPKQGEDLSD